MRRPTSIQINIPQLCSEDWEKMTPQAKGRFCDSCQKCVVDFRNYSDEELHQYFLKNSNENTCGQFYSWQIDRRIAEPIQPRNKFHRWFISLGFVIFLSELLGTEAKAQEIVLVEATKTNNEQKIYGKVHGTVLSEDNTPIENATVVIMQEDKEIGRIQTDSNGYYLIKNIGNGTYDMVVTKVEYRTTKTINILVSQNRDIKVNTILQRYSSTILGGTTTRGRVHTPQKTGFFRKLRYKIFRR